MGKLVFTIFAGLAEFELSLIVQRVRAGLERTRAEGTRLGRPPLAPALIQQIRALRRRVDSLLQHGPAKCDALLDGLPRRIRIPD
jgi:DNA invertase Pin-like site-specific DNA recombinase